MSYKSYHSYSVKRFIANFNFPNPDWEKLPSGFPNLPINGLTKEEKYLLEGIKLAWIATAGGWKTSLKKSARTSFIVLICLISLISLINLALQNQSVLAQPVQAAALQINDVIESTMSAILKR